VRLTEIIWKSRFIEKIAARHGVTVLEVEEVVFSKPFIVRIKKGHVRGEDVYEAFGQTDAGRYLVVFFVRKGMAALPISARDMTKSERRYYEKQRQ
jgi:uncharacterized DUF497 family protein